MGPSNLVAATTTPADSAASAAPPAPVWSRRLVLWLVLLAGFGVLSFMCWTLYRQMQGSKTPG